jgi:hypothetical protein
MHAVSFWDGPVSWVERLCAASISRHFDSLTVYSYDPVAFRSAGLDAAVRDASEIIALDSAVQHYRHIRQYNTFANLFRLCLLRRGLGIWVDMDCLFIRPIEAGDDYIYGFSEPGKVNNAVMRLPADSAVLRDYESALMEMPVRTPWASFPRRLRRSLAIISGEKACRKDEKLSTGPRAFTYFLRRHGLLERAAPVGVFYPLPSDESRLGELFLLSERDRLEARIEPATTCVHLWRGGLGAGGWIKKPPEQGSWLLEQLQLYRVIQS